MQNVKEIFNVLNKVGFFLSSSQRYLSSVLDHCALSWCINPIRIKLLHLCALLPFVQYIFFVQKLLISYYIYAV